MEFEKFIGGKFKTSTLPYIRSKRFHDVKLLVAGARPWASHYLFLVLMLCNQRQSTFIGQITASLIFFGFKVVQPWAGHIY
jgi:hypothetical protein